MVKHLFLDLFCLGTYQNYLDFSYSNLHLLQNSLPIPLFDMPCLDNVCQFFKTLKKSIRIKLIQNVVLVSGVQQNESVIHKHISILQFPFSYRSLQSVEQSSLCYTAGPYYLTSYLFYTQQCVCVCVCIHKSQSPNLSLLPVFPGNHSFSFFFSYTLTLFFQISSSLLFLRFHI